MMLAKRKPYVNKKLRQASEGRSCVRCEWDYGRLIYSGVVRCHYTGLRQHAFGKGRGQKVDDYVSADLCPECHGYFDVEIERKSAEKSEEFMFYCFLTLRRDFDEGILR